MAGRLVINDVNALKHGINGWFDVEESKRGIFERRGKLDSLLKAVLYEVDQWSVWETQKDVQKPIELKCQHRWRDYDWYLLYETSKNGMLFKYEIVEPYVCIHCGERKNVSLEKGTIELQNGETCESIQMKFMKRYPKLKDKPVVEDEINDAILVDREYLRIADYLRGNVDIEKKIELKIGGVNSGETNVK